MFQTHRFDIDGYVIFVFESKNGVSSQILKKPDEETKRELLKSRVEILRLQNEIEKLKSSSME